MFSFSFTNLTKYDANASLLLFFFFSFFLVYVIKLTWSPDFVFLIKTSYTEYFKPNSLILALNVGENFKKVSTCFFFVSRKIKRQAKQSKWMLISIDIPFTLFKSLAIKSFTAWNPSFSIPVYCLSKKKKSLIH